VTPVLLADGFDFPTSIAFDHRGRAYVAESGLPFGGAAPGGRVWRVSNAGQRTLLADGLRAPVNGLTFHDGQLYASEGGHPGRISRLGLDGRQTTVLDNLPGPGNYHTNMTAFRDDGRLYFSQGAMTNSGVVGPDAYELGWLRMLPHAHDLPGRDLELTGLNFPSEVPGGEAGGRALTGGFVPFNTRSTPGQRIRAQLPCTAALMRCRPDGRDLELVAWGLRNAYGIGFIPDGRLLAIDQGADERGSRPIANAPDVLYEVVEGAWYGWPDYVAGKPAADPDFLSARGPSPGQLLVSDGLPPPAQPLLQFSPHSSATKFETVGRKLYVALFGDERPMTAPEGEPSGRAVVEVDLDVGGCHEVFRQPLARPIDVRNDREGTPHVLDFGRFEMGPGGNLLAEPGSGALWRLG
jgi:glucose/arabinose dehydrogenase